MAKQRERERFDCFAFQTPGAVATFYRNVARVSLQARCLAVSKAVALCRLKFNGQYFVFHCSAPVCYRGVYGALSGSPHDIIEFEVRRVQNRVDVTRMVLCSLHVS